VTKQTDLVDEWWMEPGAGDQSMEDEHGDFWNDFLANAVDVNFTGKKILDFGCNQGGLLRRIYQKTKFREAVGVDLAVNSVAVANDRKGVIPVSYFAVKNLESIDRDFDYAVSTAVIYLISDIQEHAKEIFEHLKPGGIYFAAHIDYVTDPKYQYTRDIIDSHAAIKSAPNNLDDIVGAFESAGFKVYVKRMIPSGYIPVPISAESHWYDSATNEIDYWYNHRYSFRCVRAGL
jgi:2-polyprenyl-3-methyl-5-hydroxy-6-metoxy-1,4-benzoquinol methylase